MLLRPLFSVLGSPFSFGLLSSCLFVCGVIAVGNLIAPDLIQQILPNWQSRFGALIAFGVVLGFVRSAWRLIVPVFAVIFWLVALGAVFGGPLAPYLPSIPEHLHLPEGSGTHYDPSAVKEVFKNLPFPEQLRRLLK